MPERPESPSICIIGSGWQFTSGISYYTCRLVQALAETHPRVSAVLMRRLIPKRLYPGRDRVGEQLHEMTYPEQTPVFNGVDWYVLPSIVRAARFLRRERPDVVVLQWWTGAVLHNYTLLTLLAKRQGAKVIVEFHETQDTGEARLRGAARYLNMIGSKLLSRADGFIVHSEFDREQVTKAFPVHGRPLAVMPIGPFDHHLDESSDAANRVRLGRPTAEDPATILFFGTIRPYKGLEFLIEAFDSLPPEVRAVYRLQIVGETWEGWSLPLKLAADSPHAGRIDVVNRYVKDEEVSTFFDAADLVVLPYTRSSASGPLHIAMAHGLPIVLSKVGGLIEGASGYDGIIWTEPESAEGIRDALIRAATLDRAERFSDPRSWAHTVDSYDALIDEVMAG